jgi:hypothetical protein
MAELVATDDAAAAAVSAAVGADGGNINTAASGVS